MSVLADEKVIPTGCEDGIGYWIRALKPTQLSEVMSDGCKRTEEGVRLLFPGLKACIKYGLVKTEGFDWQGDLDRIPATHQSEIAVAIFHKALMAEDERKNSLSQLK